MNQRIHLATALALVSTLALACAAPNDSAVPLAQGSEDIVSVPLTDVERQAIGNCWIYAHASWVESMHRTATGESFDVSQSYWTYWHWFEQVANGVAPTISTGGNWKTANIIAKKYGIVGKRDFIPSDGVTEISPRRAPALAAINDSLTRGALATPSGRRDKVLVRRELDRAWGLTPEVYTTAPGNRAVQRNLSQAMTEWRQAFYPANDRLGFQLRVQKALQDAQPVIVTWFVDFNALEGRDNGRLGSFNLTTLNELGPGGQGGHMTVLQLRGAVLRWPHPRRGPDARSDERRGPDAARHCPARQHADRFPAREERVGRSASRSGVCQGDAWLQRPPLRLPRWAREEVRRA